MGSRSFPFNQIIADTVLERVAQGGERSALAHVLEDDDDLPSVTTWFKWLRDRAELAQAYTQACEARAEVKAAEIEQIADTQQLGVRVTEKADGSLETVTADMIEHRKLRIETRKWVAAKLNPKRYTERQMLEHSGSVQLTNATDDELMAEMLELLASGRLKLPGGVQIAEVDDPEEEEDDFSDIA